MLAHVGAILGHVGATWGSKLAPRPNPHVVLASGGASWGLCPQGRGVCSLEKSPSPPCWLMDVYFQSCWLVLGPILGLRTPDSAGDWLLEPTSQARYANIAPTCHPIASTSAVPSQSRAPCGKPAPSQSKSLSSQSLSGRSRGAMLAPVGAMLGLCRPRSGDHSDPPSGLPNATGLFCKKCRFA